MLFELFLPVQVKAFTWRFVSKAAAIFLSVLSSNAVAQGTLPVDHIEFSTITSPKVAYVPFRVIITAKAADGTTARGFRSTVTLTAADAGGFVPVEAQTALQFVSGQWSGLIGVNTGDTTVTLTVMDGS